MNNNDFDQPGDQFVLSQELVQLMEWILEHEADGLKRVIARAIAKGMHKRDKHESIAYNPEDYQHSVIDFFSLMELLMIEVTSEHSVSRILQKNLLPAVDHVDNSACDVATIQSSATFATSKAERKPQQYARDVFLKELLKRWKPDSTENTN